jgi:hypothetical protein
MPMKPAFGQPMKHSRESTIISHNTAIVTVLAGLNIVACFQSGGPLAVRIHTARSFATREADRPRRSSRRLFVSPLGSGSERDSLTVSVLVKTDGEELSVGSGLNLESRSFKRSYYIRSTDSAQEALDNLARNTPLTREVSFPFPKDDGTIESRNVLLYRQPLTVTRVGFQLYEAEVEWNLRSMTEFDITERGHSTGGTQHIIGSFFTAGHSPDAPDSHSLVGYSVDTNEVTGCEIIVPQVELEIEVSYPQGIVTDDYLSGCENLTGYVNNQKWRRWNAGQVLYKGAEFSRGVSECTRVVHYLGIEKNLTDVTICRLPHITKEGWDFLWFRCEDAPDKGFPVKVARHWYVDRVYPRADFKSVLRF